jgi:hypothetical protein
LFAFDNVLVTNKNVRNYEQIEVKECLLSFGAESFVFQIATQKFKDSYIRSRPQQAEMAQGGSG